MKLKQVFALLRKKQGFTNNEQVADYLNMSRAQFYNMASGTSGLKEKTVEKIMEGTGLEAVDIVAAWEATNAKSEPVKKSWEKFLAQSGKAATIAIIAISVPFHSSDANAANICTFTLQNNDLAALAPLYCIYSQQSHVYYVKSRMDAKRPDLSPHRLLDLPAPNALHSS